MSLTRRIAVVVVTATLSLGTVALAAPAHAGDTTWGYLSGPGR